MNKIALLASLDQMLRCVPRDWIELTTHRLDIYHEEAAKTEFLTAFEALCAEGTLHSEALSALPTAYDYIRLGHPLSSVLEWAIAKLNGLPAENVIAFSSRTMPLLAILRKHFLEGKRTRIYHEGPLPEAFDLDTVKRVYGYTSEVAPVEGFSEVEPFDGTNIYVSHRCKMGTVALSEHVGFFIGLHESLGSVLVVNPSADQNTVRDVQHVRRRETIAMTPANCLIALNELVGRPVLEEQHRNLTANKTAVLNEIKSITGTTRDALIGSSGLSIQFAIMMGLIDHAFETYPGKSIKFIVPPNCYGGTNDQARRVAACVDRVDIVDLHVDGDHDMVNSISSVLDLAAQQDAVPYIIAEIPTNPRVEVPDIESLRASLSLERYTPFGKPAITPVFILDQTFCPNIQFLGPNGLLSSVQTISYVSGSKFPSGGKCTAGYCVASKRAEHLLSKIDLHLRLCDNQATSLQVNILAEKMPSMLQRIQDAYKNTRAFVNFIQEVLPSAKINFVSESLAEQGFTPSVFSLDLPARGSTEQEREAHKRALNHALIRMMITEIPDESKHCVSYGQLKGCYWTIPATSTQGTTREADKDYIARVSVAPVIDLEKHKAVFKAFVSQM